MATRLRSGARWWRWCDGPCVAEHRATASRERPAAPTGVRPKRAEQASVGPGALQSLLAPRPLPPRSEDAHDHARNLRGPWRKQFLCPRVSSVFLDGRSPEGAGIRVAPVLGGSARRCTNGPLNLYSSPSRTTALARRGRGIDSRPVFVGPHHSNTEHGAWSTTKRVAWPGCGGPDESGHHRAPPRGVDVLGEDGDDFSRSAFPTVDELGVLAPEPFGGDQELQSPLPVLSSGGAWVGARKTASQKPGGRAE